jgi:hypothetical protein
MQRDHSALVAFINERHAVPHTYGTNDCVAFVLDAVEAQTGKRRGPRWKSLATGMRLIRKYGSLEAAFDHYFQRIAPALAHRGDIAAVPDPDFGIHPMIVEGDLLVSPLGKGNRRLPRSSMTMAWSATLPKPKAKT